MISGIYCIRNILDGKVYIGSAVNVKRRWNGHKLLLNKNKHLNKHLQRAWNKYGKDNFGFGILEECLDKLTKREQHWIDLTECYKRERGYNLRKLAESNRGYKHTEEFKKKISLASKGRRHSDKVKLKLSKAHKGKIFTKNHKDNLKKSRKGKTPYRNIKRWPHELGKKCECVECIEKKKDFQKYYNRKAKNAKLASNI